MRDRAGWQRVIGAVVALGLIASACSDGEGGAPPDSPEDRPRNAAAPGPAAPERFSGADFYSVPDPLPAGDHGTLIRYQPIGGVEIAGASAWRVMYRSESVQGESIAVTGTVLVPPGEPPGPSRPVLAVAHGTTGIADQCAPSKSPGASELALLGPFLDQGYVVVMTDYEGLGTPGRHPYLVGPSEGRGVLDSVRAARALPGSRTGARVAVAGYSQGGHGALWASQLAPSWTPELQPVGVFAGAPATELEAILSNADRLPAGLGLLMLMVAGFAAASPEADPALVLTPGGQRELGTVDQGCVSQVIAALLTAGPEPLVRPAPGSIAPWRALALENNPGQVTSPTPALIVHSAADELLPVVLSQRLFERMCGTGQVVERRVLTGGQGHGAAIPTAFAEARAWFQDRFAGIPATSTCPPG